MGPGPLVGRLPHPLVHVIPDFVLLLPWNSIPNAGNAQVPGCYRVVGSIQRMASSETSSAKLHDCDGKRSCMLVFFWPFYACSYCAFWGQAALTGARWPHCQTDTLPMDGRGEFQGTDPTRLFRRSTSTTGSELSARSRGTHLSGQSRRRSRRPWTAG